MVVDAESSEVLATNEVTYQAKFGDEILILSDFEMRNALRSASLLSIYRLEDELWHVNKINAFARGSHRDYRRALDMFSIGCHLLLVEDDHRKAVRAWISPPRSHEELDPTRARADPRRAGHRKPRKGHQRGAATGLEASEKMCRGAGNTHYSHLTA